MPIRRRRAAPVSALAPTYSRRFDPIDSWFRTKSPGALDPAEMRMGDLKRAVEDVILRPDENPLRHLDKRDTIAALDLCQLEPTTASMSPPSAATMNNCSCSSETVPDMPGRQPPQLCTSTSLDTIVNRPQPISYRHSAGVSRRQSRVLSNLPSKRKRSNSLTNYNKSLSVSLPPSARHTPLRFGGEEEAWRDSLGSSGSRSSVAKSDDYSQDYMAEEDELAMGSNTVLDYVSPSVFRPTVSSVSSNPLMAYRETREEEDMECD